MAEAACVCWMIKVFASDAVSSSFGLFIVTLGRGGVDLHVVVGACVVVVAGVSP